MGRYLVNGACLGIIILTWLMPAPADKIVFLDVGQGDAILLQAGTQQVLIDGGPGMNVLPELARELAPLDRKIDVVIATHPDRDHLEGLVHVLDRYEVGLVLLPKMPHTSQLQDAWLTRLITKLERKEIDFTFAWAGQEMRVGDDLVVQVLGPWPDENGKVYAPGGKTNNASVLARVDYKDLSFLLTADAEAAVERKLVDEAGELLDVDVLKAGHHGSKTSTTESLVAAASPSAAVISVGADNSYGHPHESVLARLAEMRVWRTDEGGAVRFVRQADGWLVSQR